MPNLEKPAASIIAISTDAPKRFISQQAGKELALARFAKSSNPKCPEATIARMYDNGKIEKRHVAFLPTLAPDQEDNVETRLQKALHSITPIAVETARAAILAAGVSTKDIGSVVAVSSTVLHEPGVSADIVEQLGLPRDTERTPVSFAGCAAGIAGMRVAEDFVRRSRRKCALLVTFEVPSAHGRGAVQSICGEIVHSIFADGCAVAVLAATGSKFEFKRIQAGDPVIRIRGRRSELMSNSQDGILLKTTPSAIDCLLSKNLCNYLKKGIAGYVERLVASGNFGKQDISYWAVHPGGRRIIESVQLGCEVDEENLSESYAVLREHGNMLSVAVLFVLKKMMHRCIEEQQAGVGDLGDKVGVAFSFAPGVSVEGFVFSM